MVHISEKLENWEKVYPEDLDKPDGHLYYEAAEYIKKLEAKVEGAIGALENVLSLPNSEAFQGIVKVFIRHCLADLKGDKSE